MTLRVLIASSLLLALPGLVKAQTWTSPDGFLTVAIPDTKQFQEFPKPPEPLLVLWVSQDESTRFGVSKLPIPLKMKLLQDSVEKGFAEQIGAKVSRSPATNVAGHEVWNMSAKGPILESTQAMVRHEDAVYTLLTVTTNGDLDTEATNLFIKSLAISVPPNRAAIDAQLLPDEVRAREYSYRMGQVTGVVGIVLVAYYLSRKFRKTPTGKSPSPEPTATDSQQAT
ncbi:hypothetical protein ETAA8_63170 [Anatilimnocola aggregata]|uniref:Uncharacterized protein n=1 Tax=Anatilimnocola aggregata TaxID=2528021 RepID=A0A517YLT0_9BACT|nr:hypothetical protein [Anatilimnocola aggregata]QDU31164.1 hypothetical protein ETAA8_63170 [Anatilimnocola aggregata]